MTGDAPIREQLRAIPLETLRERARVACELSSVRVVAAQMGGGRTTLRNFIDEGRTPHPRVRRLMALWFVSQIRDVPAHADACAVLLATVPLNRQAPAQKALVVFVRDLQRRYGDGCGGSADAA
jgi:hypothetical protein